MQNPIECVKKIYGHFGYKYTTEFENAMHQWINDNQQGQQGRNKYTLEMFDYSAEEIDKRFEAYSKKYL